MHNNGCKRLWQGVLAVMLIVDALALCAASLGDLALFPKVLKNVTLPSGLNRTVVVHHADLVVVSFVVWPQLLLMGVIAAVITFRECRRAKRATNMDIVIPLTHQADAMASLQRSADEGDVDF